MRYATLCSGIGGFDAGFDRAGLECVYQCEYDRACLSVLNRHWPNVPKSTDVNDEQTIADLVRLRPDIIAFGSPCQDLSVAGKRGGLAAERSGLFFRCVECCFACEAEWVVWENVPGVFSSQHGEDFASVLEAFTGYRPGVPSSGWRNSGVCVGPLYSVAWSVLDAQWFGVPQSRDRVFIVGSLGDRAGPYEILSIAESVPWNSPPSREARPDVARCLARGTNPGRKESRLVVTHALTANGHDASEDGTGRGTPIIPVDYTNGIIGKDLCGTLEAAQAKGNRGHGVIVERPVAFNWQAGGSTDPNLGFDAESDLCMTVNANQTPAIAYALTSARDKGDAGRTTYIPGSKAVRRLTPLECERLQGFPDGWTLFGADGNLADSPRYRMLGNGVAVPVAEWIARQLLAQSPTHQEAV